MSEPARIAERLGLFGPGDPQLVRRVLLALMAVYAVSFALFYPEIPTNDDESMYVRQARLALSGKLTITQVEPISGRELELYPTSYAPGTAILMAPFVELFGWRGAFVVPCASFLIAVWLTFVWIRDAGGSPFFALLVLGFPPAMVMGRVAMSDAPSAALAALGFYLFWRGQARHPGWWLASGLIAGASWALRATNPLLFVPLFLGTVIRRERKCWALIVGGLLGVGLRMAVMYAYYGSAFYERDAYQLELHTLMERLPIYGIGLLLFVPGGLVFGLLYRGKRRVEIVSTILLVFGFFLFQKFSMVETSFAKRLVLALRYFVPLLPVIAFAMSEAVPRVLASWRAKSGWPRRAALGLGSAGVLWVAGVGVAAASVHPLFSLWSASQVEIRRAIAETVPRDAVYVTNWTATRKFIEFFEQKYLYLKRDRTTARQLQLLASGHGEVYIVLLYRSDSDHWLRDGEISDEFVARTRNEPELLVDRRIGGVETLRIWRLRAGAPARRR